MGHERLSSCACAHSPIERLDGGSHRDQGLYLWCFSAFTLSSVLCGIAWPANSLIGFRILQGMSGGLLAPMAQLMMARAAGKHMARVIGFTAIPASATTRTFFSFDHKLLRITTAKRASIEECDGELGVDWRYRGLPRIEVQC
jgi:hypothetical protein